MNYHLVVDLAVNIGYDLAMCGAETFRVEDTVNRILQSYGLDSEVFAIPNYLIVTVMTVQGEPITRMRRIAFHGTDLDAVEKLNELSRAICNRHPSVPEAVAWLEQVHKARRSFSLPIRLFGDFLGAAGFSVLFGCGPEDLFFAGIGGVIIGLVNCVLEKLKVNPFFTTIAASFFMSFAVYALHVFGLVQNPDAVNIGALMILVPGLLFTNAMRDIIYGDTNSGVNRIVQVFLIAMAIALGTASSLNLITRLFTAPVPVALFSYPLIFQCIAAFLACIGFSILFNIHGPGGLLCALGGALVWALFSSVAYFGHSELTAYFWGAALAAAYAEAMARIRKYPAISYLVVSIFPLIPGAGVYYAMTYAVNAQMEQFADTGLYTAAIAGIIAVGILLVSTTVKMIHTWRTMK